MTEEWLTVREWPTIVLQKLSDAGVARIVLNRAEKRNALSEELANSFLEALEEVRADKELKVVISKGNGPVYSAGLDLYYLRSRNEGLMEDWDRPTPTAQLFEAVRSFPRVTIAQVHGYCVGGALALMNSHDVVVAANDAQIGMPEILRGSFGQMATSTLFHSGIPIKKAVLIQLTGKNVSGAEADQLGLVSMAVDKEELEATTTGLAREISTRHAAPLAHAKIAAQMGRDLSLPQAMQLDRLVGARQRLSVDPLAHVEDYLQSQKGGAKVDYKRPDV